MGGARFQRARGGILPPRRATIQAPYKFPPAGAHRGRQIRLVLSGHREYEVESMRARLAPLHALLAMLSAAVLPGAMGNAQQVSLEQPVSISSIEASASGESDNAWHRTEFVVFSATVYDRRVTELRWNEGGRAFRAVSNIDFNFFSGIGEIDLGMTRVLYLMAIGNAATIDPRTRTVLAPPPEVATALQALPANSSAYAILGDDPPESDRTLQILDKIHPYFDANRARLIQAFEAREAERLARLEYEKANPPPPFDAPLSFWLQKSQEHILKQRSAPAEETK